MRSYGIIIFARDTGHFLTETLNRINYSIVNSGIESVSIIVVDDGSRHSINLSELEMKLNLEEAERKFKLDIVRCEESQGLGNAFRIGCERLLELENNPFLLVTQLPGNDQVQEDSITTLLKSSTEQSVLATWRDNFEIRPLPKRTVSTLMHFVVRVFLFPQVKQFTSNFTVPLWLAIKYVPKDSRHAFGLWLLYGAHQEGLSLRQLPISLVSDYGRRPRSLSIRKWHRPSDLVFFGLNFFRILRISQRMKFNSLK